MKLDAPAPVVKTVEVEQPADIAFRFFTERFGDWWPLVTHSIGKADAVSCQMECREGGRIFETVTSGDQNIWGEVTEWDEGRRVAFSWHVGRPATEASLVKITFTPVSDKRSRVELLHSGFEHWGEKAAELREDYHIGWEHVFRACYRSFANTPPETPAPAHQ